jgi:hypothetical protein
MIRRLPAICASAVLALALAGCGISPTPTGSPSESPTASASPTPTAGCPATPGVTVPTGAVTAPTIDVDGDGTADTEWIAQVDAITRFGVTTASGATFSYDVQSASPIPRGGFVARLTPTRVISLLSDGRGAYVHVIEKCAFVQPTDSQGAAYTFDLQNLRGNGTGVGYQAIVTSGASTVKQTIISLNAAGTIASGGATTTIATDVPSTDAIVGTATSVTCGGVTIAKGGITLTQD